MSGVRFVDRQTSDILAGLAQVFEAYSEEEKKALIRKVCPPLPPSLPSHPPNRTRALNTPPSPTYDRRTASLSCESRMPRAPRASG